MAGGDSAASMMETGTAACFGRGDPTEPAEEDGALESKGPCGSGEWLGCIQPQGLVPEARRQPFAPAAA